MHGVACFGSCIHQFSALGHRSQERLRYLRRDRLSGLLNAFKEFESTLFLSAMCNNMGRGVSLSTEDVPMTCEINASAGNGIRRL